MAIGRKLRLYFDTSIPNHLFAEDAPLAMEATKQLWERCIAGEYEIVISETLFDELEQCPEPKLGEMLEKFEAIQFMLVDETIEVEALAQEYIRQGVLKEKDFNDCLHIACAVVNGCDAILSWNFRHLANDITREKVKVVNAISRYNEIAIVSPDEFLKGGSAWK